MNEGLLRRVRLIKVNAWPPWEGFFVRRPRQRACCPLDAGNRRSFGGKISNRPEDAVDVYLQDV